MLELVGWPSHQIGKPRGVAHPVVAQVPISESILRSTDGRIKPLLTTPELLFGPPAERLLPANWASADSWKNRLSLRARQDSNLRPAD